MYIDEELEFAGNDDDEKMCIICGGEIEGDNPTRICFTCKGEDKPFKGISVGD